MKAASQRFSIRAGFNLFKIFFQNGSLRISVRHGGCRGCGCIPKAEKLAIIRAKIKVCSYIHIQARECLLSQLRQNNNQIKGKIVTKTAKQSWTILPFFASDGKIDTALE